MFTKNMPVFIYLDTKSQSRLEDVCQNLQKKLSSVFEQTNRNYDVTDKKATVKKKSKTPKKNGKNRSLLDHRN